MSRFLRSTVVAGAVLLSAVPAHAQNTFDQWLNGRLMAMVKTASPQHENQVEPPSIAGASTNLVDFSSAPDLVGLSLDIAGAATGAFGEGPKSLTVNGYTIRTAVTGENPLNPAVLASTAGWRRWSASVGREAGAQPGGSAHLLGFKLLAIDSRDIATAANQRAFNSLASAGSSAGTAFANMRSAVQDYLFETLNRDPPTTGPAHDAQLVAFITTQLSGGTLAETLGLLTDDQSAALDARIATAVAKETLLRDRITQILRDIRLKPQLAVSYQSKLREGDGADEQRWEGIFDYGLSDRLGLTMNGSFDLTDRKLEANTRKGRVAGELQVDLARLRPVASGGLSVLTTPRPSLRLSVAGEAEWSNKAKDPGIHKVQAKFTIPVPQLKGVNIPVSVTWASRSALIKESDIRGLVGFTVDFSKLVDAVKAR
ncbi:MAG: hypothetical protein ABJC89_06955 [Acidobacteriota bacterium]